MLNISNKTISKWETGKSMPDYSLINPWDENEVCGKLDFSCFSYKKQKPVSGEFTLSQRDFDVFTKAEIKDGFGIFGLTQFYNAGGTVDDFTVIGDEAYIKLFDIGRCAAYCDVQPAEVLCGGRPVGFSYDNGVVCFEASDKEVVI